MARYSAEFVVMRIISLYRTVRAMWWSAKGCFTSVKLPILAESPKRQLEFAAQVELLYRLNRRLIVFSGVTILSLEAADGTPSGRL